MSLYGSIDVEEGYSSSEEYSPQANFSDYLDTSFVLLSVKDNFDVPKKYAKKSTIDSILEEVRTKKNKPFLLPPSFEYSAILQKVLDNLPDRYQPKIEESIIEEPKIENLDVKTSRQLGLQQIAPSLYFEKPENLVERDSGFTDYITQKDKSLFIDSLRYDILEKIQTLQQRLMIFGVPYSKWTTLALVHLTGDAQKLTMGKPNFNYQMPWEELLLELTQCVSITNEYFKLKTMINENNFKKHELAGPLIKQKLTMIKYAPPIIDKQQCLTSLERFVRKHVLPLNNKNFVTSVANLEELEDAISKLMIRFDVRY